MGMATDIAHRVAARHLAAKLRRQLADERIDRGVVQLRRLMMDVRVRPQMPAHELAPNLNKIVEMLEGARGASC